MTRILIIIAVMLGIPNPASAQDSQSSAQGAPASPGRTAQSSVGTVGQRLTSTNTGEATHIQPMARLDTRVSNRLRSRLRTRIDRDYVSTTDPTSAFTEAGERTRDPQASERR